MMAAALLCARLGVAAQDPPAPAEAFAGSTFVLDEYELTSGELREVSPSSAEARMSGPRRPSFASDSPVFRMRSRLSGYGNVEVSFELLDRGLRSGDFAPKNAWDGVHVWLRYQSPLHLYAISVNRRDDRIVIKKKVPGGDSYGGTYLDLCRTVSYPVPYGDWQRLSASAANNADGSVTLRLKIDGKLVLEALDDGSDGEPPITSPGRVGLRGDNADFEFRGFSVAPIPPARPRGPLKEAKK